MANSEGRIANSRRCARISRRGLSLPFLVWQACAVVVLLVGAAGCRTAMPATTQPAVPTDGNAALMQYIGEQSFVTAEMAYRAAYILAKGEVFAGDFGALSQTLVADRIVGASWNHAPADLVDRQTVGYMICRACGIQGGLNWRLTGLGRYAWRELQHKRIAGLGGEWALLSGGELQGILLRADEYLYRTGRVTTERADLGDEP